MNTRFLYLPAFLMLLLIACNNDDDPISAGFPAYRIQIDNKFNFLDAEIIAYLSDENGRVRAYRAVPPSDTINLDISTVESGERFDLTIVKITNILAPGSGVVDTTILLQTYTQLPSGQKVQLTNLGELQTTDLKMQLSGVTSVDSLVVSNGLAFERPTPANNFFLHYRIIHGGKIWARMLVNGGPFWKFVTFDNVSGPTLETGVDVNILPSIFGNPTPMAFPFTTTWEYSLDGVIDSTTASFFPLGPSLRAPGSPIPVFDAVGVYEPIVNPVFDPGPKPYSGFKIKAYGIDQSPEGYSYYIDQFFSTIPSSLPTGNFNVEGTTLSDNQLVAARCIGDFDVLAISRFRFGTPGITWEAFLRPIDGQIISYRLPDVPDALGNRFPGLKNYDFGNIVRVRAENYNHSDDYDAIIRKRLQADDPWWQMKFGYLGKEKMF